MRGFRFTMFCLASCMVVLLFAEPAQAFWGDYGEEPPSFFGVQLGGDIRDYPDMKLEGDAEDGVGDYYRESDSTKFIEGIPLQKSSVWGKESEKTGYVIYRTYKSKIYKFLFSIPLDDFEIFRKYMATAYGSDHIPENTDQLYLWGLYEVSIRASGHFPIPGNPEQTEDAADLAEFEKTLLHGSTDVRIVITYLPTINEIQKDRFNNFKLKYRGVVLGSKAKNYSFLRPYRYEAPDIIYYKNSKSPAKVKGVNIIAEKYLSYKGIIYRIEATSDKWTKDREWTLEKIVRDRYWSRLFDIGDFVGLKNFRTIAYSHSVGDSEFKIIDDDMIYTHLPTYWKAMRAKVADYRNVKPD